MYYRVMSTLLVALISISVCFQVAASNEKKSQQMGATDSGAADSLESVLIRDDSLNTQKYKLNPYGYNLFSGRFGKSAEDGINPNYTVSPGDKVAVRVWGATSFDGLLTVDLKGNIFVPAVGPIKVGGVKNSILNNHVEKSIRKVFKDSVSVYTSLGTAQPVSVYVTGFVNKPGRYSGIPSNSVLYFIDNAGGIDSVRGSYRNITVLRKNKKIATIDLYDFINNAQLPKPQFQDGDTIFISSKARSIAVSGEVRNSNRFELLEDIEYKGKNIIDMAIPGSSVTHVSILGYKHGEIFANYMPLETFQDYSIENGAQIQFKSDVSEALIVVELAGEFEGPSQYVVPKNTRLKELLDHIKVDPLESAYKSVSINRRRIAARQKAALEESLNRIESTYFTASSQTNEEANIRVQESKMITEFIKRARLIEPNGRLVVSDGSVVNDVRLEMGDVITIPRRKESVMINGEVMVSQAILWTKDATVEDYIQKSGGFTNRANKKRLLLIKQSGEVIKGDRFTISPGDEVVILPEVPVKNLQIATSIVDILYKIAIAASVAINL